MEKSTVYSPNHNYTHISLFNLVIDKEENQFPLRRQATKKIFLASAAANFGKV